MIKSILLVSAVCSLNSTSININPKNVQWSDTIQEQGTQTTKITIASDGRDNTNLYTASVTNKSINKWESNYITYEIVSFTSYSFQIEKQNGQANQLAPLYLNTDYYISIQTFNVTANMATIVQDIDMFTGFTDNRSTQYNFKLDNLTPTQDTCKQYQDTEETRAALNNLKTADSVLDLVQKRNAFNTALANTTSSDAEYHTITGENKTSKVHIERSDYNTYKASYVGHFQYIDDTNFSLTYGGQILDTTTKLDEWLNGFYVIENGDTIFKQSFTTTKQIRMHNTYELNINTGESSPEIIDLGGLMWEIIGMPFSFINQAFNVTLFPGTIYQFNIGNLFKAMIAILAILFVVKLFTKGIDVLGAYTTGGSNKLANKKDSNSFKREQKQADTPKNENTKE